jgi:Meiotically up-regulated gene 113
MNRDGIIDEIRRTAALNGGKPLGRLRLEKESGIKEYHLQKYWSRYNDALRDAGFEPNSKTMAYPADQLMGKLALLARQLGRFPTNADLVLASSHGSGFPSPRTLTKRFGNKAAMVKVLADYCSRTADYDDVAQLCASTPVAPAPADGPGEAPEPDTSTDGFVYLMRAGKFYKIGKTNHVGRRERELTIQLPHEAKTVHSIRTDDPDGIEAYWHKRFADKRKNGEWFDLSPHDVAAFRRRKFM